ncbi:hypothetical protein [Streptomyces sp. NPDC046887]|uniref:hypothetical protein n=1 Tax=Streptomyces sp. NPDC046887 TaxID=3155472 RepID=UPI0033F5192D
MGRAYEDEGELLAAELGAVAALSGGRAGAWLTRRVARLMPDDIHETEVELPLEWERAVWRVERIVGGAGRRLEPVASMEGMPLAEEWVVRIVTRGGCAGMNPVVLTAVVVRPVGERRVTVVRLRAVAKEGLIRQRSGQEVAKGYAAALAGVER